MTATSASNVWAVGCAGHCFGPMATTRTMIVHWNGTAWKYVASPSPASNSVLAGVTATSAGDTWAVGYTRNQYRTLIERWTGTAWKQVPSPSPSSGGLADFLFGVAATSAKSAWAVGDISCGCGPGISLILHWNGTAWTRVPSPTPGGGTILRGVAATSAGNAWAVGYSGSGIGPTKTLILRWNGKTWN